MIEVISVRKKVASASRRWDAQYEHYQGSDPEIKKAIGDALRRLDPATATREQVELIIGNTSWTREDCDECERREAVISLQNCGVEFRLCRVCAVSIGELAAQIKESDHERHV